MAQSSFSKWMSLVRLLPEGQWQCRWGRRCCREQCWEDELCWMLGPTEWKNLCVWKDHVNLMHVCCTLCTVQNPAHSVHYNAHYTVHCALHCNLAHVHTLQSTLLWILYLYTVSYTAYIRTLDTNKTIMPFLPCTLMVVVLEFVPFITFLTGDSKGATVTSQV